MKHRHLVEGVGLTPASIDDILERGKPEDWVALRDAINEEPDGKISAIVLDLCRTHHMYGTSNLWTAYVESIRLERNIPSQSGGDRRAEGSERRA